MSDNEDTVSPPPSDHDPPGPIASMLAPGSTFAGYVIEAIAGRGGMGVVYRAREARPARVVALKVISPELAADTEFRARFERESDVAASIEHPNVLPVFRVGEEAGLLFLAMRYVDGTDLAAMIADAGRVEPRRAVDTIAQVCAALDAAHARGLVHRDVKPANVLVTREGHVYLTDFGIAKRYDATAGPTLTGYFLGTIDYSAPEQIESGTIDARTDVYATGCMLYHALTGRVPFRGDNPAATMWSHMTAPPPSARDVDPTLPAPLDVVIATAMAKDPNDRYLSAGDLGRGAKAAVEGNSMTRAEHSVATGAAADRLAHTRPVALPPDAEDAERRSAGEPGDSRAEGSSRDATVEPTTDHPSGTRAEHGGATEQADDRGETIGVAERPADDVAPAPPREREPLAPTAPPWSPSVGGPSPPVPPQRGADVGPAPPRPSRSRRAYVAAAVVAALTVAGVAVVVAVRAGHPAGEQTLSPASTSAPGTQPGSANAPAAFSSTLVDQSAASGFIGFLQSHDARVVHLDVHCNGSDAAPCSSTKQAELAVYTGQKCGTNAVGGACAGAWWFDISDPNYVALTANEVGAGSLKIKGYFTVKVQGTLGDKPPEVMNVLLTAVPPQDVPGANNGPATFSSTLPDAAAVSGLLDFLRSHDDRVVRLDVVCNVHGDAPCSSSTFPVLAVYTGAKCPDGVCPGAWWFDIKDPNKVAVVSFDPGPGSLAVKGLFAVQIQGTLGSKPPGVMNVLLTAVPG